MLLNLGLAIARGLGILIYWLGLHRWIIWLNRREPVVLCYHNVEDDPGPFTRGLVGNVPPRLFERQIDFLRRYYNIVPLERLSEPGCPERSAVVTFDDGYRSVYTNAFPVLARQGLPATFYVATAALDNAQLLWINELNWLLRTRGTAGLGLAAARVGLPGHASADLVVRWVQETMATAAIIEFLSALRGAGTDALADARSRRLYLSRGELAEMAAAGGSVGSHSVHHFDLTRLSREEVERELSVSAAELRAVGGFNGSFAYPFGRFDAAVRRRALAAGYTSLAEVKGRNRPLDMTRLARITVREWGPAALFAHIAIVRPLARLVVQWSSSWRTARRSPQRSGRVTAAEGAEDGQRNVGGRVA